MENWQIAYINETRRRQDEIAVADMHRLSNEIPLPPPVWKRALHFILVKFGNLMVKAGNRLDDRVTDLPTSANPGAKISPYT